MLPKVPGVGGKPVQEDLSQPFFPLFLLGLGTGWGAAAAFCGLWMRARTMVGLLLGSCNVGRSRRLFMTNFLVMPACTCNLGLFSFEEDNMLAWELEKCF